MTFARARDQDLPVAEAPVPVAPVAPVAPKTRPENSRRPFSHASHYKRKDASKSEGGYPAEKIEEDPGPAVAASSSSAPLLSPALIEAAPAAPAAEASAASAASALPSEAAKRLAKLEAELHAASSPEERLGIACKLLRLLPVAELASLEASIDPRERKPVRLALEYTGESDISWVNAQSLLRTGKAFIKTIFSMDGEAYITWKQLRRMEEYGTLDIAALAERSMAARFLAIYLEICMSQARERLMGEGPPPRIVEEPPLWPIKVPLDEVQEAVLDAARWGRTALLVCDGYSFEVCQYFRSRGCISIEAERILNDVEVTKVRRMDDILQELHSRMVSALHTGYPIHIAMGSAAISFRNTYCEERVFPKAVFNNKIFTMMQEEPARYLLPGDPAELWHPFVSRARPECYTFVTTDLNVMVARDRLSKALPYFEDMAICEVTP